MKPKIQFILHNIQSIVLKYIYIIHLYGKKKIKSLYYLCMGSNHVKSISISLYIYLQ